MENDDINVKELSVKWQSNKDMYKILYVKQGIYLPPIQQADYVLIALIVTREKSVSIWF